MDREKQIEEMAYEIETRAGYLKSTCYISAETLYNAGYREKDSIRISTLDDMHDRLATYFGTYAEDDAVKVREVFQIFSQIAEEMLEENR